MVTSTTFVATKKKVYFKKRMQLRHTEEEQVLVYDLE